MDRKNKIVNFTQLEAWKKGHEVVLNIYTITKNFPKEEIFSLVNQMRRCAVSITSNIAEGFGRQSYKEKVYFYSVSLGSTTELQNQLIVSKDVGYLNKEAYEKIYIKLIIVHKIINGLIKSSRAKVRDNFNS